MLEPLQLQLHQPLDHGRIRLGDLGGIESGNGDDEIFDRTQYETTGMDGAPRNVDSIDHMAASAPRSGASRASTSSA